MEKKMSGFLGGKRDAFFSSFKRTQLHLFYYGYTHKTGSGALSEPFLLPTVYT